MTRILARRLVLADGSERSMQLLELDSDGLLVSCTPFTKETPGTTYNSDTYYVASSGRVYTDRDYEAALRQLDDLGAFHNLGAQAYKPGLDHIIALDQALGSPSRKLRTIHVAGTNGKGSTSSLLAAVLESAGYRTGLYTSPHLLDFRERIRIGGAMASKGDVADFMQRFRLLDLGFVPSYFECVTAMAFDLFARAEVDVAVIEVGLGGRLDSTNIITPLLSVITNISADHTAILGDTLPEIAAEKAGIIKEGVPAVIGHCGRGDGVREVFIGKARAEQAPIIFAADDKLYKEAVDTDEGILYTATPWGDLTGSLIGNCQKENAATVLNCLSVLSRSFAITADAVRRGFHDVERITGLKGRWTRFERDGRNFICDTGHNEGAWRSLGPGLQALGCDKNLKMVVGFLRDKDLGSILRYMPADADYYFVTPESDRARTAAETAGMFARAGIKGTQCSSIEDGISRAVAGSRPGDTIFVGGSTFVAAKVLLS